MVKTTDYLELLNRARRSPERTKVARKAMSTFGKDGVEKFLNLVDSKFFTETLPSANKGHTMFLGVDFEDARATVHEWIMAYYCIESFKNFMRCKGVPLLSRDHTNLGYAFDYCLELRVRKKAKECRRRITFPEFYAEASAAAHETHTLHIYENRNYKNTDYVWRQLQHSDDVVSYLSCIEEFRHQKDGKSLKVDSEISSIRNKRAERKAQDLEKHAKHPFQFTDLTAVSLEFAEWHPEGIRYNPLFDNNGLLDYKDGDMYWSFSNEIRNDAMWFDELLEVDDMPSMEDLEESLEVDDMSLMEEESLEVDDMSSLEEGVRALLEESLGEVAMSLLEESQDDEVYMDDGDFDDVWDDREFISAADDTLSSNDAALLKMRKNHILCVQQLIASQQAIFDATAYPEADELVHLQCVEMKQLEEDQEAQYLQLVASQQVNLSFLLLLKLV